MICLHMLIDYRNVLRVNFVRGQKVVPAGWLLSADGPEISLVLEKLQEKVSYYPILGRLVGIRS